MKSVGTLFSRARTILRNMSSKIEPAERVKGQKKDVWSLVNEAAAASEKESGKKVVNLGQGFFSYSPPQFAIEAAKKALDVPAFNQYSPTRGRPELLQALADSYSPYFHRKLDPKTEIVVASGANEGMLSAFMGFINPGDEVVIIEPFFDQYIANLNLIGAVPVYVSLHPPKDETKITSSNDWQLDFAELESKFTSKTKMIVLNSPHNPVGKVLSKAELEKIGDLCIKHNILILSDEVYDRLYYTEFTRIATLKPELFDLTLTVGSAGKTFAATGWRVGWLIGPEHLITPTANAHTRICFSSNSPCQHATAVALNEAQTNGYFDKTVEQFKAKFQILYDAFDKLGLPYSKPDGGYFLLVNFAKVRVPTDFVFPEDIKSRPLDFQLAYWLIHQVGVVAIPPTEFTTPEVAPLFENYLRFAVCKDDELLEEAAKRLQDLAPFIGK